MKKPFSYLIIYLLICLFAYLLIGVYSPVRAQASIESENYVIQMPNFNSGAGIPSSSGYRLDTTIGQTGAGLYTSTGYLVRSGFQYIHSIIPFSFSISDFLINFGTLIPDTPATETSTLTVSAGGAGGYSVTAKENDSLKTTGGTSIPDTTCDAGTCTESEAKVWNSNSTYGFGYNMSGNDVPDDFDDSTYFRRFANLAVSEIPQEIMGSANVGKDRSATITFKVNVSGSQAAGNYQNTILFTALPSF